MLYMNCCRYLAVYLFTEMMCGLKWFYCVSCNSEILLMGRTVYRAFKFFLSLCELFIAANLAFVQSLVLISLNRPKEISTLFSIPGDVDYRHGMLQTFSKSEHCPSFELYKDVD